MKNKLQNLGVVLKRNELKNTKGSDSGCAWTCNVLCPTQDIMLCVFYGTLCFTCGCFVCGCLSDHDCPK